MKKFLHPIGSAYVSALVVTFCLCSMLIYSMVFETKYCFMLSHAEGAFLCACICLILVVLVESNMMILIGDTLFLYGIDHAECLAYSQEVFNDLVNKHHALFSRKGYVDQYFPQKPRGRIWRIK